MDGLFFVDMSFGVKSIHGLQMSTWLENIDIDGIILKLDVFCVIVKLRQWRKSLAANIFLMKRNEFQKEFHFKKSLIKRRSSTN